MYKKYAYIYIYIIYMQSYKQCAFPVNYINLYI